MTRFHEGLKQAMINHSGETLRTSQVRRIVENCPILAKDAQFIYPSDHCINHTNEGLCYYVLTEKAIFEKIRHGVYRVRKIA